MVYHKVYLINLVYHASTMICRQCRAPVKLLYERTQEYVEGKAVRSWRAVAYICESKMHEKPVMVKFRK